MGSPQIFWLLLGYPVAKACVSPTYSTWFTRPFSPCERVGSGDKTKSNTPLLLLYTPFYVLTLKALVAKQQITNIFCSVICFHKKKGMVSKSDCWLGSGIDRCGSHWHYHVVTSSGETFSLGSEGWVANCLVSRPHPLTMVWWSQISWASTHFCDCVFKKFGGQKNEYSNGDEEILLLKGKCCIIITISSVLTTFARNSTMLT